VPSFPKIVAWTPLVKASMLTVPGSGAWGGGMGGGTTAVAMLC